METLIVLLRGEIVAAITQEQGGRLRLTYDEAWRETLGAYPVSLSMPLAAREHGDEVIRPFLEGLLPDNVQILERWGRRFHVSAGNPFALLRHVGADCAGAIQLIPPEAVDDMLARGGGVDWQSEEQIAQRLARLREDSSAWRRPDDAGWFSLGGAQSKTALHFVDGRWGVPSGSTPTTHILKPPHPVLDGFVANEHLTLALAGECGLPAASSWVQTFGDETAIVLERYDRVEVDNETRRVHQEDVCQALAVPPIRKYEADGGPTAAAIVELLRERSSDPAVDVPRFTDALLFNWLVGGTDGHAKNYSILLAEDGVVRLAPLYDLASVAPYPHDIPWEQMKLAMKLGGDYRVRFIRSDNLDRLGTEAGFEPGALTIRAQELGESMLQSIPVVQSEAIREGLDEGVVSPWGGAVGGHVERCLRVL